MGVTLGFPMRSDLLQSTDHDDPKCESQGRSSTFLLQHGESWIHLMYSHIHYTYIYAYHELAAVAVNEGSHIQYIQKHTPGNRKWVQKQEEVRFMFYGQMIIQGKISESNCELWRRRLAPGWSCRAYHSYVVATKEFPCGFYCQLIQNHNYFLQIISNV